MGDDDPKLYKKGWDGQYRRDVGLLGERHAGGPFGPQVKKSLLTGVPVPARGFLGNQKKASDGTPLYEVTDGPGGEAIVTGVLTVLFLGWLAIQSFENAVQPYVQTGVEVAIGAPFVFWWTRELVVKARAADPVAILFATPYVLAILILTDVTAMIGSSPSTKGVALSAVATAWLAWFVGYIPVRFARALRRGGNRARAGWGLVLALDALTTYALMNPSPSYHYTGFNATVSQTLSLLLPAAFALGAVVGLVALTRPGTQAEP